MKRRRARRLSGVVGGAGRDTNDVWGRTSLGRSRTRRRGAMEALEARQVLAVVPVIAEFLAVNRAGLADEDGERQDWIEIANWGDTPLALAGWHLTDDAQDPTKWTFPDVSLAPAQHLLVFASDKDRSDPTQPLHTNFRLSGDGEFLGLVDPQGNVQFAYAPGYPEQTEDISYGIFGPSREAGYFSVPTPGVANPAPPSEVPAQAIMISEIMYHPSSENDAEEYLELWNRGTTPLSLAGWSITGGVDVELPAAILPAGERLVVAADPAAFAARYGAVALLAGPWSGRLSNSSDTLRLRNANDQVVDRVTYFDEGEWSVRERGPDDRGTRGWIWSDAHDGGGKSLELVNGRLPNEWGQNWRASVVDGGTPGANNSVAVDNSAPFILELEQVPAIPRAADSVTISVRLVDETPATATAMLHWRVDGQPDFQTAALTDNGQQGDRLAGDGVFTVTLPPQPDRAIVEYFVAARDAQAQERTWPAATADAGQVTNALYQVIDEFDPQASPAPGTPVYYQIMTAAERAEFTAINRLSDAQMHATLVRVNALGSETAHNAGVRIRGSGSRNVTPPNNRINLPSDHPLDGVTALNMNVVNITNQIAGSILFRLAGLSAAETHAVRMYSNGVNLQGDGFYAKLEALNEDFVTNHFPLDDGGNLYKGNRAVQSPPGGLGAGLVYHGTDPVPYSSYGKLTNESQADWSDVIRLTDVLNNTPDDQYLVELAKVIDVDQWLRHLAMHAILSNTEGGLATGDRQGDDYVMYRGETDTRFLMLPHDLDSILAQVNRDLLLAANVPALARLLLHPELKPRYYEHLLSIAEDVFLNPETMPILRGALQSAATPAQVDAIQSFLERRAEFVRATIPTGIAYTTALPLVGDRVSTTETALGLYGTADYRASSVLINGTPAQFNTGTNFWQIGSSEAPLIPFSATWQYAADGVDRATAWRDVDYAPDGAWGQGPAELGFGDNDEATVIGFGDDPDNKPITSYFRHEFNVPDASRYHTLFLQLLVDDGAVVYLNGREVARRNLPNGEITAQTRASSDVTGSAERAITTFTLDPTWLRNGKNVLAVEVHQFAPNSADLSLSARMYGRFNPPNAGVPLGPGVNRLVIQAMSGLNGTGEVVATEYLDVWRDTGQAQVVEGELAGGTTTWRQAQGPYQVRGQLVVPVGATLVIEPGTAVHFEAGAELLVKGSLIAEGTAQQRIVFTTVPGVPDVPDLPGLPAGPPRWKGIHFTDSRSADNRIAYADVDYAQSSNGSIGVINSDAVIDAVRFRGTHYRMVYAENASIVVRNSDFPDMFGPDEDPAALGLDNISEHIKSIGRAPAGGRFIIQGNRFGTNKGHNDVIDVDSNRVTQGPIVQILDNWFEGAGDELLDLGGDVYVAGNLFRGVRKDDSTSDRGYANAISTGDAGANTTIVVTRNVFYDVDHAINLKSAAATIFEYNTVVNIHPDFIDRFGNPSVGSAINLYVDEPGATRGLGAYAGRNIFADLPRIFGNLDLPAGQTSALQLEHNLISPELAEVAVGVRPITYRQLGTGNQFVDPRLIDPGNGNFSVRPGSPAAAPDLPTRWGAEALPMVWIEGVPPGETSSRSARLTVGGPGMFAYRYRVNGGEWTEPLPLGNGFNRNGTVRTATVAFDQLPDGEYFVEVEGRDFAGNWQATPTRSPSWTVSANGGQIWIHELLADNRQNPGAVGQGADWIELYNGTARRINLRGYRLSDDPTRPAKFVFVEDIWIEPHGFLTLIADDQPGGGIRLGFGLDRNGEAVFLSAPDGAPVDSVTFGPQIPDFAIGRMGVGGEWRLTIPSLGAENRAALTGDADNVRINEWFAHGGSRADFIELYNSDPLPVELSGWGVSDAADGTPYRHVMAPLSFIGGRGFLTLTADDAAERGPTHLPFQLSPLAETLGLTNPDGRALDRVPYLPQVPGSSQGRLPDGEPELQFFTRPTPGWVNGGSGPGDLNGDDVLDIADVEQLRAAIAAALPPNDLLDLDRNLRLDLADLQFLVVDLIGSTFGDANLDGRFNSQDLVLIFQAGQYEDGLTGNSTWATGDWNADGDFGTADLVLAFQAGAYSLAALPTALDVDRAAALQASTTTRHIRHAARDGVFAAWEA